MSYLFPIIGGLPHTTNGGTHPRTIPVTLDADDSILSASLTLVAKDTWLPLVGDSLVLEDISCGLVSGQVFGVSFSPRYGTAGTYYLLLSLVLASQPDKPQEDLIYRLITI